MTEVKADLEGAKGRIRALLSKTVANGCTESEAFSAAEKAMQMMRDYEIAENELHIGRSENSLGRQRRTQLDDLLPNIGFACHCRVILLRERDEPLSALFIGQLPWPDIADWLLTMLREAHSRALKAFVRKPEYRRLRISRTRAAARRQFTAGYIEVVKTKLVTLARWDVMTIRKELSAVDTAIAGEFGSVKTVGSLSRPSDARRTLSHRLAGRVAGVETDVNWSLRDDKPRAIAASAR